jgi:hypothetical protein
LQKTSLGQGSSSQVQYDHHAFLFWPPTNLAVLPVEIYPIQSGPPTPAPGGGTTSGQPSQPQGGADQQFTGAVALHIDSSRISELGRISHPASNGYTPPITRSLVIGDSLYTLSDGGILASNLDTLATGTFVAFPAPTPPPVGYATQGAR